MDLVFIGFVVLSVVLSIFKFSKFQPIKKVVYIHDTVYIRDTIFLNSSFWLSARKCDSVFLSTNLTTTRGLFQSKGLTLTGKPNDYKFGIGLGIGYDIKTKGIYYYVLGEYVLRDYFSIGAYAGNKQVGIYGKVRF